MKLLSHKSLRTRLILAFTLLIVLANVVDSIWLSCAAYNDAYSQLDLDLVRAAMRAQAGEVPLTDQGIIQTSDRWPPIRVWSTVAEPASREGFSIVHMDDQPWREYSLRDGQDIIHAAHQESGRARVVLHSITHQLISDITLMPLMWIAVLWIVISTLNPLIKIGKKVESINLHNLTPIPTRDVPPEVAPFLNSINTMIDSLRQALQLEKTFIADAAHALRTPISSLKIQAANARRATSSHEFSERMDELEKGIERTSRLVAQLLNQAKADAGVLNSTHMRVEMRKLLIDSIAELLPLAAEKNIDLGGELPTAAWVNGDPLELKVATTNLISNALNYSPRYATVDVKLAVVNGVVQIDVIDNGPGIADHLLPNVFDRFVRGKEAESEGSGLGLAIVKSIARNHHGTVSLENRRDGQQGLLARITLPSSE